VRRRFGKQNGGGVFCAASWEGKAGRKLVGRQIEKVCGWKFEPTHMEKGGDPQQHFDLPRKDARRLMGDDRMGLGASEPKFNWNHLINRFCGPRLQREGNGPEKARALGPGASPSLLDFSFMRRLLVKRSLRTAGSRAEFEGWRFSLRVEKEDFGEKYSRMIG
jgi:hypothetical protein